MDPAAVELEELYQSHYRHVLAYCRRRLPPAEADDAAADAIALAGRHLDEAPEESHRLAWLYQIAHRLIEQRGGSKLEIKPAGMQVIRRQSDADAVAALRRLRPMDRDVLLLRHWEHLAPSEIAHVVGLSERAVEKRLARGAKALVADLTAANPIPDVHATPLGPVENERRLRGIRDRATSDELAIGHEPARNAAITAATTVAVLVLLAGLAGVLGLQRPEPVRLLASVETVQQFLERFEAGDVQGTLDLISPDAFYVRGGGASAVSYEGPFFNKADNVVEHTSRSYRFYSQHASLNADCRRLFGQTVSCALTPSGLLSLRDDTGAPTLVRITIEHFTVEDGFITQWMRASDPVLDERLKSEYEAWLEVTDPAAHSELFFLGSLVIVNFDDAQRHRDLIGEWAAAG